MLFLVSAGLFCGPLDQILLLFAQRDKIEEALKLAQLSAEKTHFSHCLEWLLFTVFEAEISRYIGH